MLLAWLDITLIWITLVMGQLQGVLRNQGFCPGLKHIASDMCGSLKSHGVQDKTVSIFAPAAWQQGNE